MTKRRLILWVVLSCGLCLIPSGWLTGMEGTLVPGAKGQAQAALLWRVAKEPLAHGLLMSGVGFSLMRLLSDRRVIAAGFTEGGADLPSAVAVSPASSNLPSAKVSEIKRAWYLRSWIRCASMTVFGIMVIAVLIARAQSLLPSFFGRGYAWGDLGASVVGGFIGILMGGGRAFAAQFKEPQHAIAESNP
ncbi:hypothetical protein N9118_10735 [Akkermansiaceae bacterium]|nr:hypothetical protein [Akkermansiaceae bacterium]